MNLFQAAALVSALALGGPPIGAFAQPQDPPPPPPADAAPPEEVDAERVRARLTRVLEQLEASADRIRGAIQTLDEGGSVEEAFEGLGGPMMVRRLSEVWERWNGGPWGGPRQAGDRGPWDRDDAERRADRPDEVMAFLREHAGELAERIDSVQAEDPRRADAFIARLEPRICEITAAQETDPDLASILTREFTLGIDLMDVGGQIVRARSAGDTDRLEGLRARMRELATEHVDLRLQRRAHEIATLEARLDALRADLEEQRNQRDDLIDQFAERSESEGWRGGDDDDRRRQRRGRRD